MEAPRLVATDVDGTLLGEDHEVSPRTAAVVGRLVARGVPFVLVTGRPPRWIPPVATQLGVVRYAVCANGAVLYDVEADRIVGSRPLHPEDLTRLEQAVAEALPGATLGVERVGEHAFDDQVAQFVAEPDYEHAWPGGGPPTEERDRLLAHPAVKLLVRAKGMSSDAMAAVLEPLVGDTVDITFSHPGGLIEVAPAGVSKATGLLDLMERTPEFAGIRADEVVAFGDMPNDLAMLRWAGHGVAMGNAHPEVVAAADETTATNVDDGVALVLERWF
ncbi:HAD family hydrolase [Pseudonocardia sp. NPDC049154]|jgi:Cof subfamily protein (haloacid dehalogenase superfamily)|uniref:HAD family hydrolase n=1 Tax=Pseudonocardia sp. NPDC049154 TaxID=3155501 RepID=UPI0033DBD0F7